MTRPHKEYVNDSKYVKNNNNYYNPFIDGGYSGYYKQYGQNHPMNRFGLKFVHNVVTGNGTDCVGDYKIRGIYSMETYRMALNKTYIRGTGNKYQNLGHTVRIRLEFNEKKNEFKGDWYVKTDKYEGCGKWVIARCDGDMNANKTREKDSKEYHGVYIDE